jgi:NAD(P)-dependent dehydrogenase (short-subunit alcohol dehydrogenase family)
MAPRRSGTILSIGSSVGTRGYANQAIYGASKHAVLGFSRALAVEAHPHGVRVACVMPGGVRTDMIGDARPDLGAGDLLEPSDVAQAVLFLLSLSPRAWVDELHLRRAAGKPG